jgi:hypothetical protein
MSSIKETAPKNMQSENVYRMFCGNKMNDISLGIKGSKFAVKITVTFCNYMI